MESKEEGEKQISQDQIDSMMQNHPILGDQ
jgi:hypothetical protein